MARTGERLLTELVRERGLQRLLERLERLLGGLVAAQVLQHHLHSEAESRDQDAGVSLSMCRKRPSAADSLLARSLTLREKVALRWPCPAA